MSAAARYFLASWIGLTAPLVASAHTDRVTGQDYRGFERNDGRGSCCDWHDCRPALEPFMEQDGEKIIDRGHNKFSFDPGKVVKRPSDDGNWHVCGNASTLTCIIAPTQAEREPNPLDWLFGKIVPRRPANQTLVPIAAEIDRELATARICKAPEW
ncbi:MAG: hypothetical protein JWM58_1500 [Rhizobium sp.]|nr:hypothetical protein [Rhizobium sp.]